VKRFRVCHPERSEGSPQLLFSVLSVLFAINPKLLRFLASLRMTNEELRMTDA
jgi:hypothetical protein